MAVRQNNLFSDKYTRVRLFVYVVLIWKNEKKRKKSAHSIIEYYAIRERERTRKKRAK